MHAFAGQAAGQPASPTAERQFTCGAAKLQLMHMAAAQRSHPVHATVM